MRKRSARASLGEANDLINFPTGPDSTALPAGDFAAAKVLGPWASSGEGWPPRRQNTTRCYQ